MTDAIHPASQTDREMVLTFQPTASVISRVNARNHRSEYRVVHLPRASQREELGPWCGSEDRAWAAACLRQGLRLRRSS